MTERLTEKQLAAAEAMVAAVDTDRCSPLYGSLVIMHLRRSVAEVRRLRALLCVAASRKPVPFNDAMDVEREAKVIRSEARAEREGR